MFGRIGATSKALAALHKAIEKDVAADIKLVPAALLEVRPALARRVLARALFYMRYGVATAPAATVGVLEKSLGQVPPLAPC